MAPGEAICRYCVYSCGIRAGRLVVTGAVEDQKRAADVKVCNTGLTPEGNHNPVDSLEHVPPPGAHWKNVASVMSDREVRAVLHSKRQRHRGTKAPGAARNAVHPLDLLAVVGTFIECAMDGPGKRWLCLRAVRVVSVTAMAHSGCPDDSESVQVHVHSHRGQAATCKHGWTIVSQGEQQSGGGQQVSSARLAMKNT